MKKQLVEGKYGNGAPVRWHITHKVKRFFRNDAPKSSIPFDWTKGISGRPVYNIKNQYEAGSCWGQMFSRLMQIILGSEELSAKSAYSTIYVNQPGGGVNLPDGEREAMDLGLTTEAKVPSILNADSTEQFMRDTSWRTLDMIKDCALRSGYQVVNVDINIDSMAQAIRDYGAIGMIIHGVNNGSWLSPKPMPPTSNAGIWGHYMCSDSNIAAGSKVLKFYQSWGPNVGENGFQYFGEDYINSGYIVDVFTFVPFKFNTDMGLFTMSEDVRQLQIRLNRNPLTQVAAAGAGSPGQESMYFGPLTKAALIKYQKLNNVLQTGFCGPLTRAVLNK